MHDMTYDHFSIRKMWTVGKIGWPCARFKLMGWDRSGFGRVIHIFKSAPDALQALEEWERTHNVTNRTDLESTAIELARLDSGCPTLCQSDWV